MRDQPNFHWVGVGGGILSSKAKVLLYMIHKTDPLIYIKGINLRRRNLKQSIRPKRTITIEVVRPAVRAPA